MCPNSKSNGVPGLLWCLLVFLPFPGQPFANNFGLAKLVQGVRPGFFGRAAKLFIGRDERL